MSAIAIVGMGCRFAGAPDLHAYWTMTLQGRHGFTPVPEDRWAHEAFYDTSRRATDKTYAPAGGFIEDIRTFPALFFGIPPRRVEVMDPQQRLSIEVGLQAIHDAGVRPSELPRRTGVFMGVTASEFRVLVSTRVTATMMATGQLGDAPEDAEALAAAVGNVVPSRPFTAAGVLANMIAAAVAQELDLKGPAYTVDAACASAVVAVHDAVAQLRSGAIDAAVVGGVYLQITPEHYVAFSRIGAMSAQGLCLPFDERADGFVQGDGGGAVLLKRLDDAVAAGDRIYAVIEGVALNNDGRGDGPMAPILDGQADVIRDAWADAGLSTADLGYVETHGTGTDVGDVTEIRALHQALQGATGSVQLGSSKANVGHTMSAAGIAGLIRTALAVHHQVIPPMSGFRDAKAALDLPATPFEVPTAPVPWPAEARVAGLSSFGFGGTNGHLVLRQAPAAASAATTDQLEIVRLSAGTEAGLRRTAARLAEEMRARPDIDVATVARTWGARPSVPHRAAFVASDRDTLLANLEALSTGGIPRGAAVGHAVGAPPKVALLFPGQGAQRVGMLASVRDRFPSVAASLVQSEQDLADVMTPSLSSLIYPEGGADAATEARLTQTEHCQPALVAAGLALWRLLETVGVRPTIATGHSLGEFVAAAVGGVLSPADALRFAASRGRRMADIDGDPGTMAALRCDVATATDLLVDGAVVANDNHPTQVVVSGGTAAVAAVVARAEAAEIEVKPLSVSHGFHSPVFADLDVDTLLSEITLADPGDVQVASGIADAPYADRQAALDVFRRHATHPVRFRGALEQCVAAGAEVFLQVGGGGPLASFARGVVGDRARAVLTLSGRDDADGGRAVLEALGWLWVHGVDLDTRPITAEARVASLPPIELPREAYWPVKDSRQKMLKLDGVVGTARSGSPAAPEAVTDAPTSSGDDVYDKVADVVARVSSYPRAAVRPDLSLVDDLGFDSLMVSDLATGLAEAFPGLGGLPQELLMNRPTVEAIAAHVATAGTDGADATFDDDAPLQAFRPCFRPCPLPEGPPPAGALRDCRILLSGARDEEITAALKAAGASLTRSTGQEVDLVVHQASFEAPTPLAAVLSAETDLPDPAEGLLTILGHKAQGGTLPSVVVVCRSDDPWSEGLAGVVRSAGREGPEGGVYKTLWFDDIDPAFRAARIVQEIVSGDRSADVRWDAAGRSIAGLEAIEADSPRPIGAGDRVLITGGTRGIGLALAVDLVARGAEVVVVGRSAATDLPAGITAVVADVTDGRGLATAVGPHRPFTAVVHAAGVLADGPIGSVDPARGALARQVKAAGMVHALAAAGPGVRVALGLGSWAGRFGNRHQAHYASGNATLAAMATSATSATPAGLRMVVCELGPWASSEMVTTIPAVVQAAMRAEGVDFVGDRAGLDALTQALDCGDGIWVLGRDLPYWSRRRDIVHPLSTATYPYLLDHAIDGVPVLPLAAATDLMAAAAGLPTPFAVEDLRLFTGITVTDPVEVWVRVDGERVELRFGDRNTLAYRARIKPWTGPVAEPGDLPDAPPPEVDLATFYRDVTFHGPLLQGLIEVHGVSPDAATGRVRSGTPAEWRSTGLSAVAGPDAWTVDPLAVDSAFQLGALAVWQRYGRAGTPVAMQRLVQLAPPTPGPLSVTVRFDDADGDRFVASFWLRDAEGSLVTVIEGTVAQMVRADDTDGTSAREDFEVQPEWIDPSTWAELKDLDQRIEMAAAVGLDNPYFHVHQGTARDTTVVGGDELVNFSSYNYLGFSGDPRVIAEVTAAVERYGTSVSASRVASGERPFHQELESELAAAQGVDDALVFTAGHMTNVNVVGHLMKPTDLVLHDAFIHDSILQGIKLSGAGRRAYRHEDPDHLEELLEELRHHHEKCLIVVEGVYSMDGDICLLPAYAALKERYGCLLMVDEAHSFGVVGATGRGVGEHYPDFDPRQADLWMGTLSKSLASCGGWIAGSSAMIRYLRYTAPGFVYSAGITPANGVAALTSLRLMAEEPWRVEKLQANAATFHGALTRHGVDTGPALGGSGVVPAVTGNSLHALVLSQRLREQHINVQPIVYPAVADDASRLRFFLSSTHSTDQLETTAEAVATTLAQIREDFPA